MESPTRLSLIVEETYIVVRGRVSSGLAFYGPFITYQEAKSFCGKRFPEETTEITSLKKETVIHGEDDTGNS